MCEKGLLESIAEDRASGKINLNRRSTFKISIKVNKDDSITVPKEDFIKMMDIISFNDGLIKMGIRYWKYYELLKLCARKMIDVDQKGNFIFEGDDVRKKGL